MKKKDIELEITRLENLYKIQESNEKLNNKCIEQIFKVDIVKINKEIQALKEENLVLKATLNTILEIVKK